MSLFEEAAGQARARGELAREVHCRASIARALAALGDLEDARAALAQARDLASRIPGRSWSWERIHVEGALDALTMATGEDWAGVLAVFDELVSTQDPVPRWARAPMSAGCARTAAHLGRPEQAMALLALPAEISVWSNAGGGRWRRGVRGRWSGAVPESPQSRAYCSCRPGCLRATVAASPARR